VCQENATRRFLPRRLQDAGSALASRYMCYSIVLFQLGSHRTLVYPSASHHALWAGLMEFFFSRSTADESCRCERRRRMTQHTISADLAGAERSDQQHNNFARRSGTTREHPQLTICPSMDPRCPSARACKLRHRWMFSKYKFIDTFISD
jgi:hypothetical protein